MQGIDEIAERDEIEECCLFNLKNCKKEMSSETSSLHEEVLSNDSASR